MNQKKIRVGLIGCGRIAQWFHIGNLLNHPHVDLVAIAESDDATRASVSARVGNAQSTSDYSELLANLDVDAVVICLPTHLHAEVATQAFNRNKHVYLEKPLASDREGGVSVVNAWRSSGRVGMVGFNGRFHPILQRAKAIVDANQLGTITAINVVQTSSATKLPAWKQSRSTGGGVLLDMASHQFDLIPHLFGSTATLVHATTWSQRAEQDSAMIQFQTSDDLRGQLFVSNSAAQRYRIEVHGIEGAMLVDRFENSIKLLPRHPRAGRVGLARAAMSSFGEAGRRIGRMLRPRPDVSFRLALNAYIESIIRGDAEAGSNIMAGMTSLESVLAAEASAQTDQWVAIRTATS